MDSKEREFEKELEVFRAEVESGIQFLYLHLAINNVAARRKKCLQYLNETPLLWKTVIGALQTSWFITLGRIFDQKSNHNVDKLIGLASRNADIFSQAALEGRKRKGSANAGEWIDEYMQGVYVPTPRDFRRLRKMIAVRRRAYENGYRQVRHQVYAHKIETTTPGLHALFSKTRFDEVQKMFTFLKKVHLALWELYHNGRKLVLRPMRHSAVRIIQYPRPRWSGYTTQAHIVEETLQFLEKACPTLIRRRSRRITHALWPLEV